MILYHGWNDANISPFNTVNYYQAVQKTLGVSASSESVRLFMAPGMAHCTGGEGPNTFDMITALERWAEQGLAPNRITAALVSSGKTIRTRPLCPYPQVAHYTGRGTTDDAVNFVCAAP